MKELSDLDAEGFDWFRYETTSEILQDKVGHVNLNVRDWLPFVFDFRRTPKRHE